MEYTVDIWDCCSMLWMNTTLISFTLGKSFAHAQTSQNSHNEFVGVAETIVGSLCVFSFFRFTSLGDCTRPQHQETTGTLLSLLFMI